MTEAEQLRRLVNGYQVSQAIHVASVLGLSDRLGGADRSLPELAEETGCNPAALYRLLRALASVGVYEELSGQRFRSTPLGDALRGDAREPVAGWAAFIGRTSHWNAWAGLLHSVRTGENAFRAVHGEDVWSYRQARPEEDAAFAGAMTAQANFVAGAVLDAYDFAPFRTVVDVGGNRGAFVAAVLRRCPDAKGMVFDQPHVVAGAPDLLERAGVADRCRVEGGSFFDAVPGDGDAYVLKNVVHDWDDEDAVAILRTCRRDMPDAATVLLIERVIPGPNQGRDAAFSDLNMLVGPGGAERTVAEYAALLAAAGLRLTRTVPTTSDVSVVEAVAARA